MKFVDEAIVEVKAGKGGNGASSFLRLKFMPEGGPDGGDGGDGGSIYLVADASINTLVDYRHIKLYQAQDGEKGSGCNCTGKNGKDMFLRVPVGTIIYDNDTGETIFDLTKTQTQVCVAKGGRHGVGNAKFKSSVNRSPQRSIPGQDGDHRSLRLELKVLADVGLVGMPNAGKSTLINQLSAARPKIADYPFTTLYPSLGVVSVGRFKSFVLADLPGLISGAAEGAGLGIRFLKHISRTRLLFHVVDIMPEDESDPVKNIQLIQAELSKYSDTLAQRDQWLILNKIDLLLPEEQKIYCEKIIKKLDWKGPVYFVSGIANQGLQELVTDAMDYIDNCHLNTSDQ